MIVWQLMGLFQLRGHVFRTITRTVFFLPVGVFFGGKGVKTWQMYGELVFGADDFFPSFGGINFCFPVFGWIFIPVVWGFPPKKNRDHCLGWCHIVSPA